MADDFLTLESPARDGGIETVRFFNGRLLSGADMGREQAAQAARDALLGTAMGAGVAYGLEVSQTAIDRAADGAVVSVQAGLAISESGKLLHLATDQRLRLARSSETVTTASDACLFGTCVATNGTRYASGEGLYLLVATPAKQEMGRAQVNGLPGDSTSCNVDRDVASVAFRLLEIRPQLYNAMLQSAPGFRNAIAYMCFGSGVSADWPVNLAARTRRDDDLVTDLRAYGMTPDDVPLALVAFMVDSSAATDILDIRFLDMWAVRRPCTLADPLGSLNPALTSLTALRRPAAGRAMFEQFQQHLAELRQDAEAFATVTAREHFPQLPPVGVLPGMNEAAAKAFLGGITVRGKVHINSAQVEPLIRESLSAPAIRSASNEVVWLYAVAENLIEGAKATVDASRPDPYLIFASGNLPYRADARFNLHRWNYANFALAG
jgi:hypothetical protein